jgi:hypothetical protein
MTEPPQQEGFKRQNDVEIGSIFLIKDDGRSIDVSNLVMRIDIFEDIYSHFMTALAVFSDGMGVRTHFPISGNEQLKLSYKTPGIGAEMETLTMNVVSITKREINRNNSSESYELELQSNTSMIDKSVKISKAYSGTISDIVGNMLSDVSPDANFSYEPSVGEYKFTIPNMRLSEAIKMVTKHAVNKEGSPNYVFYETVRGFVFQSVGNMSKESPARDYDNKLPGVKLNRDSMVDQFNKIQDIQIEEDFDINRDLKSGMIGSRLVTHDLISKTVSGKNFNYIQDFDQYQHVNSKRKIPSNSRYDFVFGAKHIFMPKASFNHGEMFDQNQNYEEFIQAGISTRQSWVGDRLLIKVSGDSRMRPGYVVNASMPSTEPKKTLNDENFENKYTSGRYVVTSIRHQLINTGIKEYTNTLELSRDSLPIEVPVEKIFEGDLEAGQGEEGILENG